MCEIGATPFTDAARAVAAHHGVAEREVAPAPSQGQVNVTFFLGRELVLRIPRTPGAAEKLAKEAEVIPLVREVGVPTPALVDHDVTGQVTSEPHMVLERVHGRTFAEQRHDEASRRRALGSLGEILSTLHQLRRSTTFLGPGSTIPEPFTFSASELIDELAEAGEVGRSQRDWLRERLRLLAPDGPSVADPVLLHRDVIPANVMIDRAGGVTALLDWGCAEWGSPARDLVGLPIRDLVDLLDGYRSGLLNGGSGPEAADAEALARSALWYHHYLALARLLKRLSTSDDRNWAAPRSATLVDLLAFTSTADPEPWSGLLRRDSTG